MKISTNVEGTVSYDIEGFYEQGAGGGWELVTAEATRAEARLRLIEYRANEPGTRFRMRAVTS